MGQDNPGVFNYRAGLHNVGSYQASSIPFVSASIAVDNSTPVEIRLPQVSKFVILRNEAPAAAAAAPMRIGFSSNGIQGQGYDKDGNGPNNNYFILNNDESIEADFRVSKLFFLADTAQATSASVAAGLTSISFDELGKNWSGSAGIG